MSTLTSWSKTFCDEKIIFIMGGFKGQQGIFERCTGYSNGCGAVCKIYIPSIKESREFTSDFFNFVDEDVQVKWDSDDD